MRNVCAIAALSGLFACGGSYTAGSPGVLQSPKSGISGTTTCAAASIANAAVLDSCSGSTTATAAIYTANATTCTVSIDFGGSFTPCAGSIRGSADAFTGTCGTLKNCTASSLPGAITCTTTNGTCAIRVCNTSIGGC